MFNSILFYSTRPPCSEGYCNHVLNIKPSSSCTGMLCWICFVAKVCFQNQLLPYIGREEYRFLFSRFCFSRFCFWKVHPPPPPPPPSLHFPLFSSSYSLFSPSSFSFLLLPLSLFSPFSLPFVLLPLFSSSPSFLSSSLLPLPLSSSSSPSSPLLSICTPLFACDCIWAFHQLTVKRTVNSSLLTFFYLLFL